MSGRTHRGLAPLVAALALTAILGTPSARADAPPPAVPAAQSGTAAISVDIGTRFSCAVLSGGRGKCWGRNRRGQLGQGDPAQRGGSAGRMGDFLRTIDVGTGLRVTSISAGIEHTCALLNNGTVKCWGGNFGGQLGQGDTEPRGDGPNEMGNNLPTVRLGTGRKAKAIAAGGYHTCAILDNSSVKCWGYNSGGVLGLGDTNNRGDGPNEMGNNLPTVNLGTGRKAKAIAANENQTCVILDNGSVKCWGFGGSGQLGTGNRNNLGDNPNEMGNNLPTVNLGTRRKAKAIAAGGSHVCAILDNGSVKCWGYNPDGQLGLGDTNDRGDDPNEMGNNLPAVNLGTGRKAKSIAAGGSHTCAILDNGALKCWGDNNNGQLGIETTDSRGDASGEMGIVLPVVQLGAGRTARAVAAGEDHTCALLDNATVKCWGYGGEGQLGTGAGADLGDGPNEMGDHLDAVNLGVRVRAVEAYGNHSCALLENHLVECWGDNDRGQLGNGTVLPVGNGPNQMGDRLRPVDLGGGHTVLALSVGPIARHTCAILDDRTVKCWGNNSSGQLGYGDIDHRGDGGGEMGDSLPTVSLGVGKTAKRLYGGLDFTCALLTDGGVKCWGENGYGQLGIGSQNDVGDGAGEMGSNLVAVDLGAGRKAKAIGVGWEHACALLDNGSVKCWGGNGYGQLGMGDTNHRGDDANEMGNNLPAVNLGTGRKAKALAVGGFHTCVTLDNNTVKCWGYNVVGQLGYGNTIPLGYQPDDLGDRLDSVNLGTGRRATTVIAGYASTCAILDNRSLKCWGYNGSGQLGLGNTRDQGDEDGELGDFLPAVPLGGSHYAITVSVGGDRVCVLLDDRGVKCWGNNGTGGLGLGDTANRGDGAGEMGNALPPVALTG